MEINASRNSAIDVIAQSIMNKEEGKKRPSFSTIFDKLNKKKISSKKPLNNLLTQDQMFRYYINDSEPLLKVSNDGFLQNLDLFGGSDLEAQYEMMQGQISLGTDIKGKRTIPEGFEDPELIPKKVKSQIEPKIEPKIEDPQLIEDPEILEEKEEEEVVTDEDDEEDIEVVNKPLQLLNFDFAGYEAGNEFLRIEPKKDEFEDALERDTFMQIYGEQQKLEDLIKASTGAYLPDLQKLQVEPFLTIPAKKQEIEPKIEEAGMDIPQEVMSGKIEPTDKFILEPQQPKGQLRKYDDEWIIFKKKVIEARNKGSTKTYRANIEKWLKE
jgi:hypothetical protein